MQFESHDYVFKANKGVCENHNLQYFSLLVFDGFINPTVMDVAVETIQGEAVALECDFAASNPPPKIQWFANETTLLTVNSLLRFLDGDRYLYIQTLTSSQREMQYHCEVTNFLDENGASIRAPTTYIINTEPSDDSFVEYKGLGSQVGTVGESLQFVYVAVYLNASGHVIPLEIDCPSNPYVMSVVNNENITATLLQSAANQTEVTFTCQVLGNITITGTIVVSGDYLNLTKVESPLQILTLLYIRTSIYY